MTIGDRIHNKRIALGHTLEYIGERVGVTRATIQKYENGLISSIPSDKIELLARALNTSPAYLMGWEEKESAPDQVQLTEGEKAMLDLFNRVPVDQQQLVLQMIRAALGSQE